MPVPENTRTTGFQAPLNLLVYLAALEVPHLAMCGMLLESVAIANPPLGAVTSTCSTLPKVSVDVVYSTYPVVVAVLSKAMWILSLPSIAAAICTSVVEGTFK